MMWSCSGPSSSFYDQIKDFLLKRLHANSLTTASSVCFGLTRVVQPQEHKMTRPP